MTDMIERHYRTDGIADRVLGAVRAMAGPQAAITVDLLAPVDHFHNRGVVATRELAALLAPKAGERILDIGCGIGGPARWFAHHHDVHVTGIDLTESFCRAAEALNAATGLAGRVRIVHGNALDLPFEPGSFDRAYSQNVVMNVADKQAFYREAARVLKPGGLLALSNLAAGPNGPPHFPAPWASEPGASFLATPAATRADIAAAGLEIVEFRDIAAAVIPAAAAMRARLESEGLPVLSVHVFMGERFREAQINSSRSVEEGRVIPLEILARKPG